VKLGAKNPHDGLEVESFIIQEPLAFGSRNRKKLLRSKIKQIGAACTENGPYECHDNRTKPY
jgi:hypothetical protein